MVFNRKIGWIMTNSFSVTENKVSLEQWRALLAVIDAGGYAKAAEQLNKSQSAVSYAISQLESALNVKVFNLQGRKAVATPSGAVSYTHLTLPTILLV